MNIQPNGKAITVKETFSRETAVAIKIDAPAETVWSLLTDASDMARWNSTIVSLNGNIEPGGKVELKSILDEKRTFKLNVKVFEPHRKLVWGDRQGSRTYQITKVEHDKVVFEMREKIGGLMFPLYGGFIPPFDDSFEQYAADLKAEAERISA